MNVYELETARLRLRDWRDADLEPFVELNTDSEAMRFYPRPYDRTDSEQIARRIRDDLGKRGWGLWAVEVPGVAPFIGFVGLHVPTFEAHFTPCVEVGWRLWRPYFGRGYATEAGRAALAFGFDELDLHEIVSMTAESNAPSRAVMERLGMTRDPADDFDHPSIEAGHPLQRHVLYRLSRSATGDLPGAASLR